MFSLLQTRTASSQGLADRAKTKLVESALAEFQDRIGGKLIYVLAMPELPTDGLVQAAFGHKGVSVKTGFCYMNKDAATDEFCEVITSNGYGLASIHFSLNRHVDHFAYKEHPFVALIPANSELLLQTVSISFAETIVLGDYKLPADTVIMARSSDMNRVPDFYKNNFKVVEFDDSHPEWRYDFKKKMLAIDTEIINMGGAKLKHGDEFWTNLKVLDHSGTNINTLTMLQQLFPTRAACFGTHEYTRFDSNGEFWRDYHTSNVPAVRYLFGEIGFSIQEYHSEKLRLWLGSIGVAPASLELHARINKYNLICARAMDLIFAHFRAKKPARAYLTHVKEQLAKLEGQGKFNVASGYFDDNLFATKSVDELAKMVCDYEYMLQQPPSDKFDLITVDQISERLIMNLLCMHPIEANKFLTRYFQSSSFIAYIDAQDWAAALEKLQNWYALYYTNNPTVSEQMLQGYSSVLIRMCNPDFKIILGDCKQFFEVLFLLFDKETDEKYGIETDNEEAADKAQLAWAQEKFAKAVAVLKPYRAKPSFSYN